MSAQILDNNEDGQVDDPLLSAAALENDGQIAMFEREGSPAESEYDREIFRILFFSHRSILLGSSHEYKQIIVKGNKFNIENIKRWSRPL